MITKKKFFIFDFDGVMCDSTGCAYQAHNLIAKKYGLNMIFSSDDFLNIIDNHNLSKNILDEDIMNYYDEFNAIYEKKLSKIKIFKNAKKFLLSKKNIVIITSNYEKIVRQILIDNEIDNDVIVIGKETGTNKSNRLNLYIKKNNLKRDEIVYIGDTYDDYLFCTKEKIKMIGVNFGYSNLEKIKNKLMKLFFTDESLYEYIVEDMSSNDNN